MTLKKAKDKLSPLSEFSLYTLLSLYEDEKHGYGVILKTRGLTNGELELKTATVYSAINRFIEYGLVKYLRDEDGKKYYQITEDGKFLLEFLYLLILL
jgi:DNA-binding PadR family transcriptional regulator